MIKRALFSIFLLLSLNSFAQKAEFDSIINLLENHPQHDTVRVNWLMQLQKFSVFDNSGDFLPYMEEALEISQEIGYNSGIGNSLNGIGVYYFQKSDYDIALDYVLKSISVLDSFGLKEDLILPYNNLAMINNRLEHYEEAEKAYKFIISQLEPKGTSMQLAAVNNNLGVCLYSQKKYEESAVRFRTVVDIAEELGFKPGIALGKINLSKSLNDLKSFEEALKIAQDAYGISKSLGMKNSMGGAARELGRAYSGLNQDQLAMSYADTSVLIFEELQQMGELFPSLFYQSEIYNAAGKSAEALEIFQHFHELQDSVHSEETKSITESMRAKFETDQAVKDKKLAEAEKTIAEAESKRNQNFLMGAIAVAILILIIAVLYINRMRAQKKAEMLELELEASRKRAKLEDDLRESRMKAIRSQLNPHFIFNALNSIQYLFYSGDKKTASQFMGDFATLMRNVLDMSTKAEVSIEEEQKMLSHYLDLEKLRMENAFDYHFEIDPNIDPAKTTLPTMLLQPYVENSVKHAFKNSNDKSGKLNISIEESNDALLVKIEDNGVGLNASKGESSEHKSFSSGANAERLKMINEGRENAVGVKMIDLSENNEGQGTRVEINIPLSK